MKWTTEPPVLPGWYWWRGTRTDPRPVRVYLSDDFDPPRLMGEDGDHSEPVARFGGEWYGPLEVPGVTDLQPLLKAILADPDENVPVLALADFLAENGAHAPAAALRAAVALRENPTVYLASSGSYSEYGVRGVFSSKENAEKFMAALPGDDWNDVENFTLDAGVSQSDAGLLSLRVAMDAATGDGAWVERDSCPSGKVDPGRFYAAHRGRPVRAFVVSVWARDEEHAVKIANERREMLLAQSPGVPA